jgi:TIR domain-containing protein
MPRNEIFVSYSHRDRKWLDELIITLAPLIRNRNITIWDDTKIAAGQRWKAEITGALERAKVAVLLVTRSFLASEFIVNEEMPHLLDAANKAGLTVVWIAVGDSLYEETEITEYQAANDPGRPLNSLSEAEVDRELVRIAKKLNALFVKSASAKEPQVEGPPSGIEEVSVQNSLLDQIASEGRISRDDSNQAEVIASFGTDALTPAQRRLREALADSRWAWRSLHALASSAGLDDDAALEMLQADPLVRLGRAKSGKIIAQLKARAAN